MRDETEPLWVADEGRVIAEILGVGGSAGASLFYWSQAPTAMRVVLVKVVQCGTGLVRETVAGKVVHDLGIKDGRGEWCGVVALIWVGRV